MALITIIEVSILVVSVYYLYYIITNYSIIKTSKQLYEEYKSYFLYSLIGAIGLILSFQIFWFTDFYDNHPYIEILIKIILGVFSIINQMLISDLEKEKQKIRKKKNDDDIYSYTKSSGKYTGFKLINRLYLLNIVFKFMYRKK